MIRKCETCKYFQVNEGASAGQCRRYPPRVMVSLNGETVSHTFWPRVRINDWCGEWMPKENKQ